MFGFSQRRIQLMLSLSIYSMVFVVFCALISQAIKEEVLRNFCLVMLLPFALTAYLSKKEKLHISRPVYLVSLNVMLTLFSLHVGKIGGVEYILMFSIGLPFFLFSYRREKPSVVIFSVLPFLSWLTLYFTDFKQFNFKQVAPETAYEIIYPLSTITTVIAVISLLIHYFKVNKTYSNTVFSEQQRAQEESNAKSNFLSTMSHEIRTPLNAIIGLSNLLAENNPRKDQEENINALNYSGKLLMNLLNNVLDFSKLKSSKIHLDKTPVDLFKAIKQIKKVHEPSCLKKGIIMLLDIDQDLPVVLLDSVRFNQVINNLVSNSIKFTDEGSVSLIIKKVQENEDSIAIRTEVIDTGLGIPKDRQEDIWKDFTQASSNTNRLYGGTGLGLPIVKSIIKAMGSDIHLESEPNKGSRFCFEVTLEKAKEQDLEKNIATTQYDFADLKVLIVEDNEYNILVSTQILEKEQVYVDVARNGLESIEKVKAHPYDVVLMDIQMPLMDGYEASAIIKETNPRIPIIALTASVIWESEKNFHKNGFDGFIMKPFQKNDLFEEMNRVMTVVKSATS